ncbi:dTDP-4-dehydrorhamnose reductase [Alteromonadaceae bacterium BrNp21-10]|nr:dTDP-4-dehydrorhamnose reductase [Alteromonadaceae bacterium BrNp21-10]
MIIVIGKSGQLAKALVAVNTTHQLLCLGRDDIELTSPDNIQATLLSYHPSAIINASAYTAVDKAESEPEQAYALNELSVANLAEYCVANGVHLVHVSTDYVFDGQKGSPYTVDDIYGPHSVYGKSKMAGEQAILGLDKLSACIIRTSWVYSEYGQNFVKTMLRLMQEKPQLGVIDDQIGSPTSAKALARACLYAASNSVQGVHHFTDAGVASWYDFAVAIQQAAVEKGLLTKSIPISPIPTSAYPTPAKRPAYSVLDKSTLQSQFNGLQPVHWQQELATVIDELK